MSLHASFSRKIYWPLAQKLKGEYAGRALGELSASQWKNKDDLLLQQWQRVRRTVNKAAREVPFYRETFRRVGWDLNNTAFSYEDFLSLPKLEKDDVRDCLQDFLNHSYHGKITEGTTSGSTGKSLKLYYSSDHESYSEAARWRGKSWWGIDPGAPQVTIWGRPYKGCGDFLIQKLKSYLMNTLLFSGFELDEEALDNIWRHISRFKPSVMYGYPTAFYTLATYVRENSITTDNLAVKVIITPGETITTRQRTVIEETFGCKAVNEYGCSETGGFVYECPQGSWHISTELTFIEFLDRKGNPVSSGRPGEIFVTHLRNDYMPLIRYRVGDLGASLAETCTCGRGLPLMNVSVAKESDVFRLKNGKSFSAKIFDYMNMAVMKAYPSSVLHFRVIQKTGDTFEVEVVTGRDVSGHGEQLFTRLMREQLGQDIQIQLKKVAEIQREPSGKLRYFISEVERGAC